MIDRHDAVYSSWVENCSPSVNEEARMLSWFDYLEDQPDSPAVDAISKEGFAVTIAPGGEQVAFLLVYNPDPDDQLRGAIVLREIACR